MVPKSNRMATQCYQAVFHSLLAVMFFFTTKKRISLPFPDRASMTFNSVFVRVTPANI